MIEMSASRLKIGILLKPPAATLARRFRPLNLDNLGESASGELILPRRLKLDYSAVSDDLTKILFRNPVIGNPFP